MQNRRKTFLADEKCFGLAREEIMPGRGNKNDNTTIMAGIDWYLFVPGTMISHLFFHSLY